MCTCGHERAYHVDAYQCIAKRDLYQCGCMGYRADPGNVARGTAIDKERLAAGDW